MTDVPSNSEQPTGWEALDLTKIEPRPKQVIRDDDFALAIDLSARQQRDYVAIVGLIATGGDLDPYYRRSDAADLLLKTRQIMHFHLGGPGSNAILYAIQYRAHVLLLRVDNHIHLDDFPPGKRLLTRGRVAFQARLKTDTHRREEKLAEATKLLLAKAKPKPAR